MARQFANTEEMAQRAWDEISIVRTISRVAQAQDDLDYAGYCSCFTDTVLLSSAVIIPNWTGGEISAGELALKTFDSLSRFDVVHHMVFNHLVEVEGDAATCVADLHALSILIDDSVPHTFTIGGRYFLRLRRERAEWRIWERSVTSRYQFGDQSILGKAAARPPVRQVKGLPDEEPRLSV